MRALKKDFNHVTEHVGRNRIFPGRAGVIGERQFGQLVDEIRQRRLRIENAHLIVGFE